MKKNDLIFATTILFFSILFWKQMPGLNFFIFTILLLGGQVLMKKEVLQKRNWIFSAIGALCSTFCVLYYGNTLSIFASFFSLLIASYFAMEGKGSILIGMVSSLLSIGSSLGFMISRIIERRMERMEKKGDNKSGKRFLIVLIALLVVMVFVLMYRESSVMFYNLTQKINFDFISITWIVFTFIGALIVFGFYYHNSVPGMSDWDSKHALQLSPSKEESWMDKMMSMDSEQFSGIVLLTLLNILLLIVNGLDAAFIFGGGEKLPVGITYTQYVHQGVGMLITSIVCAMLIILYYFRGRMNFSGKVNVLRNLAIFWIIQNAFMLFSTMWRNDSYIFMFGLTYKRIGVFVYLLLTLIGLFVTAWKVYGKKTNAFLVRTNSWLFYSVWVIACFVNWDGMILNFNTKNIKEPDVVYMSSLSDNILPDLLHYTENSTMFSSDAELKQTLSNRIFIFLSKQKYVSEEMKWPSYQWKAASMYNEFKNSPIPESGEMLNASDQELKQIYFFPAFENVASMDLSENDLENLGDVGNYHNLTSIDLRNNHDLKSLEGIQSLDELQTIYLYGDDIKDFGPLLQLKNLKTIGINSISQEWIDQIHQINPNVEFMGNY
jgi:hypothetical protein